MRNLSHKIVKYIENRRIIMTVVQYHFWDTLYNVYNNNVYKDYIIEVTLYINQDFGPEFRFKLYI